MASKRKRVVLSMKQKVEVIEKLERGVPVPELSSEYNIGLSTIYELKKSKAVIINYMATMDNDGGDRKSMKRAENFELEDAVHAWYQKRRNLGEPVSGALLCQKALEINLGLGGGSPGFKASSGWLKNFKSRHGILDLETHEEQQQQQVALDQPKVESFRRMFLYVTENGRYERDNVYNADETVLNWKSLPRKALASTAQASTRQERDKQTVTVMTCSNASGTHRLPILMVGRSKKLDGKKGNLPIVYRSQTHARMDTAIFQDWVQNTFISEVKKFQQENGRSGNVLLVLDNAPSHPCETIFAQEDDNFHVVFMSQAIAPQVQPMNQSVTETFKYLYRKELLHRLQSPSNVRNYSEIIKGMDLKHGSRMIATAWAAVPSSTLLHAWDKLWPPGVTEVDDPAKPTILINEMVSILKNIPGCEKCDEHDVLVWLSSDNGNSEHETLFDHEMHSEGSQSESSESEDDEPGPSHAEALSAFEVGIKWLERQSECEITTLQLLTNLRDLAAKKTRNQNAANLSGQS